ncbi:hypothetical protein D3C76_1192520 [compost metagenome]
MAYIRKGTPELMTPSSMADLSLPLNLMGVRSSRSMTASPMRANRTRRKVVLTEPNAGAAMRMNRKLAPQMAASTSSLT